MGQVKELYVHVLGLSRILGTGFWVSSYFRPGVRDSSLRSEFNLDKRNDSLCDYGTMRAHFKWGNLKTAEVGVIKSFTVVGDGELDRVV